MSQKSSKQRIFEAAARLFQEKGYKASSMRELAERVNLEASSLYSHIKSKEEILQKICLDNAEKFSAGLDEIEKTAGTAVEKLTAIIKLHVNIAFEDSTAVTVFNDEWRHLSEPTLSEFLSKRKAYENRIYSIVNAGIQNNEFVAVDPKIAVLTILSSLKWVYYKPNFEDKMNADAVSKEMTKLLLGMMKK